MKSTDEMIKAATDVLNKRLAEGNGLHGVCRAMLNAAFAVKPFGTTPAKLRQPGLPADGGRAIFDSLGRKLPQDLRSYVRQLQDAARIVQLQDLLLIIPNEITPLVIAAREAFDTGMLPTEEQDALDRALEPFSERVPYENEPGEPAS